MKKNWIMATVCALFTLSGHAQNVGINTDASLPNKNAILDVKSSNKGILIPRMSTEARNRIPNTQGLLVYDINTDNFWYNTGREWRCIPKDDDKHLSGGDAWLIKGNNNTTDKVNFLGTTNNVPLNIRMNNQPSGRIDSASANTFWGYRAGASDTSGGNNTAIGFKSLFANTSGSINTAIGSYSLYSNTTGGDNIAEGYLALYANTNGSANTAIGDRTLVANTIGSGNVAIGYYALNQNISGGLNTAVGSFTLTSGTDIGGSNTAIGTSCMMFHGGDNNTASGSYTLYAPGNGSSNAVYGSGAMLPSTTASYNVAVGVNAMPGNISGNYNTGVGYAADVSTDGLTNATALGNGAVVDASNKVRIGNSAVTVIEGQVPFTTPSDGRFKFNVKEDVKGLDFILQLRPVTYQFDVKRFDEGMGHKVVQLAAYDEASRIRRSGFIAQEVEKAAQASGYNFSGIIRPVTEQDHYSLSYEAFVVPLVKAVQEQQQTIDAQNKKIAEQDLRITRLEQILEELKKNLSK